MIPLWTVPISYDARQILAWGLVNFEPIGNDHEIKCVMETAIRDKATEIMVDATQIDYLDRLGCAAFAADHAVRIDADKFIKTIEKVRKRKHDKEVNPQKKKSEQMSLFD